ncbi:AraC family transcriptional regulator, partial [Sphingobacterium sp. UBA5670]|uniref:AraC family transcriptional regulator n=1 Tax=Sphingobacterium sp. UBA5670 TaxID=1947502 RepID=UPI0025E63C16
FHSACQMTYIVESEGKRIIGDNISNFASDELTFVGPDLPHVWHNNNMNCPDTALAETKASRSLALYIEPKLMIKLLGQFFQTNKIEAFFLASKRGLLFRGATKEQLKQKLKEIVKLDYGFKKTILLLEIMELMLSSAEFDYLSSAGYTHNYSPVDNSKIDSIFKFVFNNYTGEIQLDQVAKLSNMSKHSFCRYFKSRTQKTFVQFVNEVRISESCRLIVENKHQITHIAYACGFNSLSNFNKIFKSIKGVTPSQYKSQIR